MRLVTSVSKTQAPASPPEEPLPEEPLGEPLPEELPDKPVEEPVDEPLPEALPDEPLDPPGLVLPHPVAMRPAAAAVIVAMRRANPPFDRGLMCRYHSRPGWASGGTGR